MVRQVLLCGQERQEKTGSLWRVGRTPGFRFAVWYGLFEIRLLISPHYNFVYNSISFDVYTSGPFG